MSSKNTLFDLYKRLYAQRAVLSKAPALTINTDGINIDTFDSKTAEQEVVGVITYLLGGHPADNLTTDRILAICTKSYVSQPFWYDVILDYLRFRTEQEREKLNAKTADLMDKSVKLMTDVENWNHVWQEAVTKYADAVKEQNFAVDAHKLINNYFNMSLKDPELAYDTLIHNPAYFAPIITTDKTGKQTKTPAEAQSENKKLGAFLKRLSVTI